MAPRGARLRSSAAAPTSSGSGSGSSGGVGGVDDVGDQAGDVVGAAGLEAGADQLDRGVVRAAGGEDVGEPAVVEDAAGAVAAQQQPVAGLELDVEQVGLGLVDAVERAGGSGCGAGGPGRRPR